jgi:hypothetical protein
MNTSQRLGMAIVVAAAVSAVCAAPAIADYTYTYTGNDFTSFDTGFDCCNIHSPYSPSDRVTISLTYSAPLPHNSFTSLTGVNPLSGFISDGVNSLSINPTFDDYAITLQTNPSGQIITWSILAGTWINGAIGGVYSTISSDSNGITGSDSGTTQNGDPPFGNSSLFSASSQIPGAWDDPSPVPTTNLGAGIPGLVMVCGTLLVWWRTRRPCRVEPRLTSV